ncbi:hypothetical protein ZWY2020_038247 [Hordeum vulgare]|nr:hypothetical protein ZWY2020_038247 [Hordeum vulgare]
MQEKAWEASCKAKSKVWCVGCSHASERNVELGREQSRSRRRPRSIKMCCCPSKACCICMLIILVLIAVGLVFGFGVYTRGFHKLSSNIHLQDGASYRAYGHLNLAPPPSYY